MRNALGVAAAAVVISSLLPPASFAQRPQEVARCEGKERPASPDPRIRACSALILSGNFSSETLARMFVNRADAYEGKGDLDHAIQDFAEAIRLNPQDAHIINRRANAYRAKGDLDRANQDYDLRALLERLSPDGRPGSTCPWGMYSSSATGRCEPHSR